jgi:hypothetical protein
MQSEVLLNENSKLVSRLYTCILVDFNIILPFSNYDVNRCALGHQDVIKVKQSLPDFTIPLPQGKVRGSGKWSGATLRTPWLGLIECY